MYSSCSTAGHKSPPKDSHLLLMERGLPMNFVLSTCLLSPAHHQMMSYTNSKYLGPIRAAHGTGTSLWTVICAQIAAGELPLPFDQQHCNVPGLCSDLTEALNYQ